MSRTGAGFSAGRPDDTVPAGGPGRSARLRGELRRHPSLLVGGVLAAAMVIAAIAGHVAPPDNPLAINPGHALAPRDPGTGSAPTSSDATCSHAFSTDSEWTW